MLPLRELSVSKPTNEEMVMENATTAAVVVAGFFFSVMCALLMEELIFGGMFRFFFAPRAVRSQNKLNAERKL
jgi:hypothetical protein